MKAYLLSAAAVLFLSIQILSAQQVELSREFPTLSSDGDVLEYAFAGGLNSPQYSACDFDNDGIDDIFIFDRVGNVQLALHRQNNGDLVYAPELLAHFPAINDWVLLRDYDGDGIQDLFCYNSYVSSGIQVYQGSYNTDDGLLDFERIEFSNDLDILYFTFSGNSTTQIYVSQVDYPAIDDMDCDGDLDILTFNVAGGYVEYFRNTSVENGNGLNDLTFVMETNCWGGIFESGITNVLELAEAPGECAGSFSPEETVEDRHAGSTLLTFDEDGDGDKDLLLGDLSFSKFNLARNGGDCNEAWINEQDPNFPSYDQPGDIPIFPASFYIDINNDGKRDLVGAPNEDQNVENYECGWYYENVGTDDNPNFDFQKKTLFVDEMLDMGSGTHPAFLDFNADGLMDLVVGNRTFFEFFGAKNTRLYLLQNIGTAAQPEYELVDENYLDMNQYSSSTSSLSPSFGDLDGDGDMDALIGEQHGQLFFMENTAGAGQPVAFGEPQYGYMGIAVGQSTIPQLIDLNRDGLLDIILGERSGSINYFQNVGTATNPQFGSDETVFPNQKKLGEVDTRIPGFSTGYSAPYFVDRDGESFLLLVGSRFGKLEVYDNIDNNLEGAAFNLMSENIEGFNDGIYTHPVMSDFDGDGLYELVVGNERGGLGYFSTNVMMNASVPADDLPNSTTVNIFPNPVSQRLHIETNIDLAFDLTLHNINGQLAQSLTFEPGNRNVDIDVSQLPSGVYVLGLKTTTGMRSFKVVVE